MDSWPERCTDNTTGEPEPSEADAELIAENPAESASAIPIGPQDSWGYSGTVPTITYTDVWVELDEPDPDDCSHMITYPDYAEDLVSCDGTEADTLSAICEE